MIRFFSMIFLFWALSAMSVAQNRSTEHVYKADSTTVAQAATIADFSMLIGNWTGKGLGGNCDENWLGPVDNRMHGIFRLVKDGKLVFTEYMNIGQDSTGWALKVKHFMPDFVGWEEKDKSVDFRFIRAEKNALYFSGITFVREEKNKLAIYLAFRQKNKTYREEVFTFEKY